MTAHLPLPLFSIHSCLVPGFPQGHRDKKTAGIVPLW